MSASRFSGRLRVGALVVACLIFCTACLVRNPRGEDLVDVGWGDGLVPSLRDVPYVEGGHVGCGAGRHDACFGSQTLDVYVGSRPSRGTLVFVHGGGFVAGDKGILPYAGVVRKATVLGWSVVSVNYRLAGPGGFGYPAALEDVSSALHWVRANGSGLGLVTSRLVVVGESAGGTLAALVGTAGGGHPSGISPPPVSGWVSIAGLLNFRAGPSSERWGRLWMGDDFVGVRDAASAVRWVDAGDPPGYLVHGDRDELVEFENSAGVHRVASANGSDVHFDAVDVWEDGSAMPELFRGHLGVAGMNATEFYGWLGRTPDVGWAASPFGNFDVVRVDDTGATVAAGWMVDPDVVSAGEVHVYVNGRWGGATVTGVRRGDVRAAHPTYGELRGWELPLGLSLRDGDTVCAYGINKGDGTVNTLLGCKVVTGRG